MYAQLLLPSVKIGIRHVLKKKKEKKKDVCEILAYHLRSHFWYKKLYDFYTIHERLLNVLKYD